MAMMLHACVLPNVSLIRNPNLTLSSKYLFNSINQLHKTQENGLTVHSHPRTTLHGRERLLHIRLNDLCVEELLVIARNVAVDMHLRMSSVNRFLR